MATRKEERRPHKKQDSKLETLLRFGQVFAGKIVIVGWLLLLLMVVAAFTLGVYAAVMSFYHPLHRYAPFEGMIVTILKSGLAIGFFSAIFSSIGWSMKARRIAAGLVVLPWVLYIATATVALALTRPGPEKFERYVGPQRYLIPWQYEPWGSNRPTENGFSLTVCLQNFHGGYSGDCPKKSQHVEIKARVWGLDRQSDVKFWRSRASSMDREKDEQGYQVYKYTSTNARAEIRTYTYYALQDSRDRLLRLVKCSELWRTCEYYMLVGEYSMYYHAERLPVEDWVAADKRIVRLVDSWKAN